ncbi:hypothetical protein KXX67_006555 [Aspergillus fumigatus]|nr:hypothetical protein KXX67_006555 [Aspergillus fumigatus]KAH3486737.1 hypothetical protein KXW24_006597 [Aspergillus fumigatus]
MEQIREPVLQGRFQSLDEAAKETTTALARANIRHGFIGGYADIDIIVDADPSDARSLLLQAHSGFRLSQNNKLIFTGAEEDVVIELLRVPIVAPSVLVLTKIKRWSTLAESTRPQSIKKADSDIDDIEVLLKWLARNQFHIDFEGYLAKPKEELLSGLVNGPTVANDRFSNTKIVVFISAPIPSFHPPHGIFNSLLEIFFTLVIVTFTILRIQWLVA